MKLESLESKKAESVYFCGCSKFTEEDICPDHDHKSIVSASIGRGSQLFSKGKQRVLKSFRSKTILKHLPENFDYLNIDLTDVSLDFKFLSKVIEKADANAFIQIRVEEDTVGVETMFDSLGLTYAGESILLTGKVKGYKKFRALYFYPDVNVITKAKFNMGYQGTTNLPDLFWLKHFKCKSAVFLNVNNNKCCAVLNTFKNEIFIHTYFSMVAKSLINKTFRNIFPGNLKVPNE